MTNHMDEIHTSMLALSKLEFTGYILLVLVPALLIAVVILKLRDRGAEGQLREADQLRSKGDLAGAVSAYQLVLRRALAQIEPMQLIPSPACRDMVRHGWPAVEGLEATYAAAGVAFDRAPLTRLVAELRAMCDDPNIVKPDLMPRPEAQPVLDDLGARIGTCIAAMPTL